MDCLGWYIQDPILTLGVISMTKKLKVSFPPSLLQSYFKVFTDYVTVVLSSLHHWHMQIPYNTCALHQVGQTSWREYEYVWSQNKKKCFLSFISDFFLTHWNAPCQQQLSSRHWKVGWEGPESTYLPTKKSLWIHQSILNKETGKRGWHCQYVWAISSSPIYYNDIWSVYNVYYTYIDQY